MPTPITIVGAGLGGLTLARVLQVHGVDVTVVEADLSPAARAQGGLIDIHAYNGMVALEAADLIEEFESIVIDGAQHNRVLDPDGSVLLDRPDWGEGTRPEVHRGELRRILLNSLAEGTVRWGRKVTGVRPVDGGFSLTFTDATVEGVSLLVGADGAWSKVRGLLTDARPAYVGRGFIETYLHEADVRHADAAEAVGGGSLFVLGPDGQMLGAHRETGGTLHTYLTLTKPEGWFAAEDFADSQQASVRVAAEIEGWAPGLVELITGSDTPLIPRPHYCLPIGLRWDRVPGVALIGDAAHLATPDGEGANQAMLDGAELGQAIAANPDHLEDAIAGYEQAMFTRSYEQASQAEMFQKNSRTSQDLVDALTQMGQG